MAFHGCEFSFDGIPCSEFGLTIYDFGSTSQKDTVFGSGEIIEDRLANRFDSLMYGFNQNEGMEYTLVFGANIKSLDAYKSLDRYDIEAIAAWLTGHNTRKWLTITQEDLETFRYKCIIKDLELVTEGKLPWAFTCKVCCDSQFAYTLPEEYNYNCSNEATINLFNRSSYNGYFYPKMKVTILGGDSFYIINNSDNNRKFEFTNLPTSDASNPLTIFIDNKNQIISNSLDMNLYPNFNKKFFRMVRGNNKLSVSGNVDIGFVCEFPVNIGG